MTTIGELESARTWAHEPQVWSATAGTWAADTAAPTIGDLEAEHSSIGEMEGDATDA